MMKSLGFRLASGSVRNIARSCSGPRHCFSQFPCCQAAHPAAMEVGSISSSMPQAVVGQHFLDVETPALVVDLDEFDRNCAKLKESMTSFPDVNIRVHCKAHKCGPLADIQLNAIGGTGVCCQKVSEAEAMVESGIKDIFLSNEIVDKRKLERFIQLAEKGASLKICVDDSDNISRISEIATSHGAKIGIVVEVNVGQDRCGVNTHQEAITLANKAMELNGVTFEGIQAYQGALQHIRDPIQRQKVIGDVVDRARSFVSALEASGVKCSLVTGGGSGSYKIEARSGVYTEVQPGSFCFSDVDYSENLQEDGTLGEWNHSLFVLATVISKNVADRRAVVDAGLKSISFDSGPPRLWPVDKFNNVAFHNGGDEHGIIQYPEGWEHIPDIGTIVQLVPGHCDPTVNMHEWIMGYRGTTITNIWPLRGRGPGI